MDGMVVYICESSTFIIKFIYDPKMNQKRKSKTFEYDH